MVTVMASEFLDPPTVHESFEYDKCFLQSISSPLSLSCSSNITKVAEDKAIAT